MAGEKQGIRLRHSLPVRIVIKLEVLFLPGD